VHPSDSVPPIAGSAAATDQGQECWQDWDVPVDPPAELAALPPDVWRQLEERLQRIPVERIRWMADYYALRSVESEHITRIARGLDLPAGEQELLSDWWLQTVDLKVKPNVEQIMKSQRESDRRWMTSERRRHLARRLPPQPPGVVRTVLFQAKFNTVGPGGRTWFGNRYVGIRRHTFRLHWRP
jgi:hypothetical protein